MGNLTLVYSGATTYWYESDLGSCQSHGFELDYPIDILVITDKDDDFCPIYVGLAMINHQGQTTQWCSKMETSQYFNKRFNGRRHRAQYGHC